MWLVGVALQYLLVDILRLREAAGRVVLDGEVQSLLDSQRLSWFRHALPNDLSPDDP